MDLAICAACKLMTGPCTLGNENACVMAPYFPSTEPENFDRVNKVFGVVYFYKILSRLEESWQHEYAVKALCYKADALHTRPHTCDLAEPYLFVLINEMLELNEEWKNQLTGLLDVDEGRNIDEIVGMRKNDQGDVHRADCASTSSGPSSGPPNQNQP
uniref:LOB domain-containing protein n=1 Tax=Brassica campestris TaxID=3711 RepID=M4DS72_BRACM